MSPVGLYHSPKGLQPMKFETGLEKTFICERKDCASSPEVNFSEHLNIFLRVQTLEHPMIHSQKSSSTEKRACLSLFKYFEVKSIEKRAKSSCRLPSAWSQESAVHSFSCTINTFFFLFENVVQ